MHDQEQVRGRRQTHHDGCRAAVDRRGRAGAVRLLAVVVLMVVVGVLVAAAAVGYPAKAVRLNGNLRKRFRIQREDE